MDGMTLFSVCKPMLTCVITSDGNGTIDFDEFVAVMAKKVETSYTHDEVKEAFKTFEVPGHPGLIKAENLIKALGTYSTEKLTEIQLKELVNQMDSDGSGFVNYMEFIHMMM